MVGMDGWDGLHSKMHSIKKRILANATIYDAHLRSSKWIFTHSHLHLHSIYEVATMSSRFTHHTYYLQMPRSSAIKINNTQNFHFIVVAVRRFFFLSFSLESERSGVRNHLRKWIIIMDAELSARKRWRIFEALKMGIEPV